MTDTPILTHVPINGVKLAVWEWLDPGPPVLFVHATGFHGRCWDQIVARMPGHHCYALDVRGHGRSDKPAPPYHWRTFGEDVATLLQALGLREVTAVGHSMGGHAVALAAALAPEAFARAVLIDPVIFPQERYNGSLLPEHFAARRRNHWASPEEMIARFKDRPPFNRWEPTVLRDYCTHGLLPAPNNDGFVLACPPEVEAAIYANSVEANIYPDIARVSVPVHIVRSSHPVSMDSFDMAASPTAPDLAAHFSKGKDTHLPQYTHFLPMEDPEWVASYILTR